MTTVSSGNISSTSLVTQAYLNITQSITQGVLGHQLINVDCKKNTESCNKCIETAKKYALNADGDYSKICNVCLCTLENVNIKNVITIDVDAFTKTDQSLEFQKQVRNSLTQKSASSGSTLFTTEDRLNSLNNTSAKMYSAMEDVIFQNSLQELKNFQVLNINNPNSSVINVDIDLTIDFISKLLQQNTSTSSILEEYDTNILQITTQIIESVTTTIISWIVTLFIITIVIIFFVFGINIIMQVFSLYAST
jgi:hypothetical protein